MALMLPEFIGQPTGLPADDWHVNGSRGLSLGASRVALRGMRSSPTIAKIVFDYGGPMIVNRGK
jgi:hypothetical protein